MALEAGVPVMPVAMIDTDQIQPPGKIIPKIMRVGIRIGEPLDFSRYEGMEGDRFVLRSITDEIMYELMNLSGQEYVDIYATKAKAEIAGRYAAPRRSVTLRRRARRAGPRRLTVRSAPSPVRQPPSPSTAPRPRASAGARPRRADPARTGAAGARSCASSSVDDHTPVPSPARNAAPRPGGLLHLRAHDRDPELVGLQLAEQVVGRRAAVDGQLRQRDAGLAAIRSTTSRTSNAIASRVARTRCARVVPRVIPMIEPAGVRVPVGGAEAGQRRHEHDAAAVGRPCAASASVSAAAPMIPQPVAQPLDRGAGDEHRALERVRQARRPGAPTRRW